MRHLGIVCCMFLAAPALDAGSKAAAITLVKEDKTFFVPANFSPIRTVRLKFHPREPFLLGQVTDRRVALWHLDAPIPDKAPKGQKGQAYLTDHALRTAHRLGQRPGCRPGRQMGRHRRLGPNAPPMGMDLWQAADKPSRDITAHDGWIEAVAFSSDGSLIATAGSDKLVKLWQTGDLGPVATLVGHDRFVRDLAWTKDGQFLASGDEAGKVLLWDVPRKKLVRTLEFGNANEQQGQDPAHSGVSRLSVSADGKWLAVAGHEKVTLFELATGVALGSARLHFDVLFHPQADSFLAGQEDTKWFRLDAVKAASAAKKGPAIPAETVSSLRRGGYGVAFHPDGSRLAAAIAESTVALWRLEKK